MRLLLSDNIFTFSGSAGTSTVSAGSKLTSETADATLFNTYSPVSILKVKSYVPDAVDTLPVLPRSSLPVVLSPVRFSPPGTPHAPPMPKRWYMRQWL